MSTPPEKKQESRAVWYGLLGLAAVASVGALAVKWLPADRFMAPPDLPSTSQVNQRLIQGENAPMLAVTPSQRAAIGQGCRVSDIALVQSWRGPFRQTTVQSIMAWEPRARRRSSRLEIIGWSARAPAESELPTDGGLTGCVVSFTVRDGRREKSALWRVSDDRTDVAPANDLAREITAPR